MAGFVVPVALPMNAATIISTIIIDRGRSRLGSTEVTILLDEIFRRARRSLGRGGRAGRGRRCAWRRLDILCRD